MTPYQDDLDDDYSEFIDCDHCGGEGGYASCQEDCCPYEGGEDACDDPACWRKCSECRGKGGWKREEPVVAMPERAPCPFCGASDSFVERATLVDAQVICNNCHAHGPSECQDGDGEETPGEHAAIRAWNRRANPSVEEDQAAREGK